MSGNAPAPNERDLLRIVRGIRDLFEGRSNAFGSFTCELNAASTTVTAPNCGPTSEIFLQAKTANAATEVGNGTIYVSAVGPGSFTVTHANSATASRTFAYRIGG
ncbi:hypothetical protein [Filomicrobium sp.]|uniref:hypothetical protein n=1 Tax=Filomicrobium sp. TaxID=2024831 RepID=UPI00258A6D54|nr:hypothetical protein [Filomicrobium sp.]MCV0371718.1 hypothetical protein [Filomicrobium sp.]